MATRELVRGLNVSAIFVINDQPTTIRTKSVKVDEELTDGYDEVGGEHRGRPFRVTDGFKISIEPYMEDASLLDGVLGVIANQDADLNVANNGFGIVFKFRDGTRAVYKCSGNVTLGPLSVGYGSRTDPVMLPSYFRAQFFDKV